MTVRLMMTVVVMMMMVINVIDSFTVRRIQNIFLPVHNLVPSGEISIQLAPSVCP